MKKLVTLTALFITLITLAACRQDESKEEVVIEGEYLNPVNIDDNYGVYYEIFVGGFSDSNEDGIGDIQGIINRLDYLNDGDLDSGKSLGIEGIWLMPIMPSPTYHKYDARDYKAIDPAYGTMEDFELLIEEAGTRDIDIIIDLVVNHTSSYHPWFRDAKEALRDGDLDNPYLEYYTLVTEDEMIDGRQYYHFEGEYYYEANFWSEMPELNFDSQLVKDEMASIVEFWLNKGVKGFRLDAVKYPYFNDTEKNLEMWEWFMDTVTAIDEDAYVVGEMWDSNSNILDYYSVFNNFDFAMSGTSGYVYNTVKGIESVNRYVDYLADYQQDVFEVDEDAILQPFISNHDMDRAAGYLPVSNYDMHMAANLYMLTYGNPFIYYGEEIGMRGSRGNANTDANRRLGMLWGDSDTVEDPTGSTWPEDDQPNGTVEDQLYNEDSLYNHYKKLIMLRQANPEIARGTYTPLVFEGYNAFGGFLTTYNDSTVAVLHNNGSNELEIDLSEYTDMTFSVLRGYVGQGNATLDGDTLTISGRTSVIIK